MQNAIDQARVARNTDPNIFTEQQIRDMETRIGIDAAGRSDRAKAEEATTEGSDAAKRTQDATRPLMPQSRPESDKQNSRQTIADYRTQVQDLMGQAKYEEALHVIDQILAIDPTNDYAKGLRPLVEDKALLLEQRRYREDFNRQFTKQLNAAEERKVPYDDILHYPSNWPDISEMRDQEISARA